MLFGHGGDVYSLSRELGIKPQEVLDFSSNCSPLPYPDGFQEYLFQNMDQLHLLPEVDSYSVREKLSERYGLPKESFLLGSGTTQWIFALPRILDARRAFIPLPTYSDYSDSCHASGVHVEYMGPYVDGSRKSAGEFISDIKSLNKQDMAGSLFFLCNPNNPTGLFIAPADLMEIIRQHPETTWIIDEAYAPFIAKDRKSSILVKDLPPNVVILRSFSKIYGIPGLRIGCLVTTGDIMRKLRASERPWAVNRMAQIAACFLLDMPEFENQVRDCCMAEKQTLLSGLSGLDGFTCLQGAAHFALFKLSKDIKAKALAGALRQKGMLVRDCENFKGLEGDHIRVSPRMHDDNLKLIKAVKGLVSEYSGSL